MKTSQTSTKAKKGAAGATEDLVAILSQKVVGQPEAARVLVPYIQMFQAGLSPEGRPAGIFLLLGPTGTGKTKTVEALAEILHGSEKTLLKVDCGEFQMEHEVAKLIGAPPGYLGHRETQPLLTQQKLNAVTSDKSGLSIVLFDEIEKAAPSMTRLLLGILDKATLRLGDNTTVNFEKSLVFLTSNLGAREMMKELNPDFGFNAGVQRERGDLLGKLQNISLVAVRKKFSPEFVNRIDCIITYQPLDSGSLAQILDHRINDLQRHVNGRLGARCFSIEVSAPARDFLLEKGTSAEYGARELNRTIHRELTQPLSAMVATAQVAPGSTVRVELAADGQKLELKCTESREGPAPQTPSVLIVDDNRDLLRFLERLMADSGWKIVTAESVKEALRLAGSRKFHAALLDYLLPDGNGVDLAMELKRRNHEVPLILMTGSDLDEPDESRCAENDIPLLRKPFLAADVMNQIRSRMLLAAAAEA